jgi:hypothetical protein
MNHFLQSKLECVQEVVAEEMFVFLFFGKAFHLVTIFRMYLSNIIAGFERFLKISSKE